MSNTNNDRQRGKIGYLAEDFIMIGLLAVNLFWIVFDWLFQSEIFRSAIAWTWLDFHDFYAGHIHPDFVFYDLIFVGIFLTEFFLRWIWSVAKQDYRRWYYFPFVHWYDILGCIPIGSFRFFRLLRIFSIALRLHRLGWIDLTQMPVFGFIIYYYNMFVQEVTDRVSLRILSDIREEVEGGSPVIGRILAEVLRPRQEVLTEWISERVRHASSKAYEMHHDDIRDYVGRRITVAVENNEELRTIESVPFMGKYIVRQLEKAISDIVFNVVHGIISDLSSEGNKVVIDDISGLLLDESAGSEHVEELNRQVAEMVSESLEIIMERVRNKTWSESETEDGIRKIENRIKEELSE